MTPRIPPLCHGLKNHTVNGAVKSTFEFKTVRAVHKYCLHSGISYNGNVFGEIGQTGGADACRSAGIT